MDTAFVIGNGESRKIFPIENLKGKGVVYGCNAIYRDHPGLCDHIVAVNKNMFEEVKEWYDTKRPGLQIHGPDNLVDWDYLIPGDESAGPPEGLKLYRIWRGGDIRKGASHVRTIDFSLSRGSGASAVLLAAESGVKNVIMLAFDIVGAKQWEHAIRDGSTSREQNNIYKNTKNYPSRVSMKAYLKYEWMYQLRQIFRRYSETNFYFTNRRENIEHNHFLRHYLNLPNVKVGIYADLNRWINNEKDRIHWTQY